MPSKALTLAVSVLLLLAAGLLLGDSAATRADDAHPPRLTPAVPYLPLADYWLDDDADISAGLPQDEVDEQEHVYCLGALATLVGGPGDDVLVGTDGPDVILGRAGDDRINGKGGDDILCAGSGNNLIIGGPGDD